MVFPQKLYIGKPNPTKRPSRLKAEGKSFKKNCVGCKYFFFGFFSSVLECWNKPPTIPYLG